MILALLAVSCVSVAETSTSSKSVRPLTEAKDPPPGADENDVTVIIYAEAYMIEILAYKKHIIYAVLEPSGIYLGEYIDPLGYHEDYIGYKADYYRWIFEWGELPPPEVLNGTAPNPFEGWY